ncbi:MAG TPA: hypothetical protein VMX97_06950 [Hyphomicrobiaceae bacterium]|nr:hypothetical protein [Hyphomicrobiaceae bacterium]
MWRELIEETLCKMLGVSSYFFANAHIEPLVAKCERLVELLNLVNPVDDFSTLPDGAISAIAVAAERWYAEDTACWNAP